jgi:excisionase family DNA binding protein
MLTLTEAGALLGRSRRTLYLQYRKGRLQAEKHGSVLLVDESEVRRYAREVLGKTGFASPLHPLHGTRGGGWRRRGGQRD